jgi:hypothetical protein
MSVIKIPFHQCHRPAKQVLRACKCQIAGILHNEFFLFISVFPR